MLKREKQSVRWGLVVGALLVLTGCQNAALNEITKRATSVAKSVTGENAPAPKQQRETVTVEERVVLPKKQAARQPQVVEKGVKIEHSSVQRSSKTSPVRTQKPSKSSASQKAAERAAAAKAEQEKKKRLAQQRRKALNGLLNQAEKRVEDGDLSAAEKLLQQYLKKAGKGAKKQKRYQAIRQKLDSMSEILADLERARDAERQLQKLLVEGEALAENGMAGEARKRYQAALSLDPENQQAQAALKLLAAPVKKPAPKSVVAPKRAAKKKSSLLGKKAEGWVVQVATYIEDNKKQAYGMLGAIKKAGFKSVYIRKQELAGRVLYRLRLGAYGDKAEAESLRDQLNQKMGTQGFNSRVTRQKP